MLFGNTVAIYANFIEGAVKLYFSLAAVKASHPLRLNFSVVNYFRFIYHKELIHVSEAVY